MEGYHKSVLLKEATQALRVKKGEWYLDCTLGDGGHSLEILKLGGNIVGLDVDPEAIRRVKERLGSLGFLGKGRVLLIQGNFRDINNLIQKPSLAKATEDKQTDIAKEKMAGAKDLAGAIFDLGVSSLQLETPRRGFSFAKPGELDMRMDPTLAVRALDLVSTLSRKELYELFSKLGEEKYSWRLAGALVRSRQIRPVTTTGELADVIVREVGGIGLYRKKIHPATRVFQALRMAVNDETGALAEGLEEVKDLIKKDGRIVVISFHSLEDRIAKNTFKGWESAGMGEVLSKKPVVPKEDEISVNPRARSAKMRIFKKI